MFSLYEMSGGSLGNLNSGLNENPQRRCSSVKNFAGSRRQTPRPYHLSFYSSTGTRSEENIPLVQNSETTFTDIDSAHSPFPVNGMSQSGRQRTSSLTSDVSSHTSKGGDSGNSSLIDSSSTDSYPDLRGTGRSRTASASRSEQNFDCDAQSTFLTEPGRERLRTSSDALEGSQEVISRSAEQMETPEQTLHATFSDSLKDSVIQSNSRNDSQMNFDSQPSQRYAETSLAISSTSDNEDRVNTKPKFYHCSSFLDTCDEGSSGNTAYSETDAFNTTAVNMCSRTDSNESLNSTLGKRVKNGSQRPRRDSAGSEDESTPLLTDDPSHCNHRSPFLPLVSTTPDSRPLRRTSSLGDITHIPHSSQITCGSQSNKTSPLTASQWSDSTTNSQNRAASSASSFNTKEKTDVPDSKFLTSNHSQFYPKSSPQVNLTTEPSKSPQPVPFFMGMPPFPPSSAYYGVPPLRMPALPLHNNPPLVGNYHPLMLQNHLCSMNDYQYRGGFGPHPYSETAKLPTRPVDNSHTPSVDRNKQTGTTRITSNTPDNDQIEANTVAKTPVQNAESVLGYGAPLPSSVLKSVPCSSSSEYAKPLQVLVPKPKEEDEAKIWGTDHRSHVTATRQPNGTSQGGTQLQSQYFHPVMTPRPTHPSSTDPLNMTSSVPHDTPTQQQNGQHYNGDLPHGKDIPYPQMAFLGYSAMYPTGYAPGCDIPEYAQTLYYNNHLGIPYSPMLPVQTMGVDPVLAALQDDNPQLYGTHKPEPTSLRPSDGMPYVKPSLQPPLPRVGSQSWAMNSCTTTIPKHLDERHTEPASSCFWNGYRRKHAQRQLPLSKPGANCSSEEQIPSGMPTATQSSHCYSSASTTVDVSPSVPAACFVDVTTELNEPTLLSLPADQNDRLCFLGHLRSNNGQIPEDCPTAPGTGNLNQDQMDESGYRAGMQLRVPTNCFEADFLEASGYVTQSGRENNRESSLPSVDSGGGVNKPGSIQQSNTSQLGLLKATKEALCQSPFLHKDIPDYRLLCVVAAMFNPVFGLIAYICNRYARRNYRCHRYTRANHLYFATINISTIGVFLTLIGLALFAARSVVSKVPPQQTQPLPGPFDCLLKGEDDGMMEFYGLSHPVYCEGVQKPRVVNALRQFWYYVNAFGSRQSSSKSKEKIEVSAVTPDGASGASTASRKTDSLGDEVDQKPLSALLRTGSESTESEKIDSHNRNGTAEESSLDTRELTDSAGWSSENNKVPGGGNPEDRPVEGN